MKLVSLERNEDKGEVQINPESISDIRTDPDGLIVVRMTNGASYKLKAGLTITDVTAALQGG
jgi:hypothetical protein